MKMLLLGNGFDLYHKLPTKYENFLHTVDFLRNKKIVKGEDTVGEIFGNSELQKVDRFIKESYEKYKSVYDKVSLDFNKVSDLIDFANNNIWFSYLLKSFNKDLGWIDFEKEIAFVIKNIQSFMNSNMLSFFSEEINGNQAYLHILKFFDFFHKPAGMDKIDGQIAPSNHVIDEYKIEIPTGSNNYELDKEKLVNTMFEHLTNLSEMLKIYLKYFVDEPAKIIAEQHFDKLQSISDAETAITLNYTNTFEHLYKSKNVFHIHGDIDNNIVLGINSDDNDELEALNTDFIHFKKYCQRVRYKTDTDYIKFISEVNSRPDDFFINLTVIGHSLDISDKDIIMELFNISNCITIYYYNEKDVGKYIKNLVSIYGKNKFDKLRLDKYLTFLPLKELTEVNHNDQF